MSKSLLVHYKNKYPGHVVLLKEDSLDVYSVLGEHKVAMRKDGSGNLICQSKEQGAAECHDLSPLPKNARAWRLAVDGSIEKVKEFEERKKVGEALAKEFGGKVPSLEELEAKGYEFEKDSSLPHKRSVILK